MAYKLDEEQALQRKRLTDKAVSLAVQGHWEEAAKLNKEIIKGFPGDVEAYNRLGKALTEMGEFAQAKKAYRKALGLAPGNSIAKKNIARLDTLPASKRTPGSKTGGIGPELFVAESTKSGIVNLHNLTPDSILARVTQGDQVKLAVEGRRLIVNERNGEFLGEVEPRHSSRLVKLIKGGNKYAAAILNVKPGEAQVIIKEIYQHPEQIGIPSFPVRVSDSSRRHSREGLLNTLITRSKDAAGTEPLEEDVEESEEDLPDGFSILEDLEGRKEIEG